MTTDLLTQLLTELNAPQARYAALERYATGTQPLAFISPESRKALGNRLSRMVSNIPALAVSSLVERLRIVGFSDPRAWNLFVDNDLDQLAAEAMSDALTYGSGYVLVWAKDGQPVASVESPRECAVLRDPADRSVIAGVKRYETDTDTHVYIYLPDSVQHWHASRKGASHSDLRHVETVEHHLGTVPLVPIDNPRRRSELDDLAPLCDGLNKLLLDMMVASEAAGRGRRWVTGLELTEQPVLDTDGIPVLVDGEPLTEAVNPVDELASVAWAIGESPETKFGTFGEADLSGFEAGVRITLSQIMAVSALPSHYLGILTSQPTSADALRASEASLTARAEARQQTFGRAWERVGQLLIAVSTGATPEDIPVRIRWADASTRSTAQEADAATKLYQSGLFSRATVLRRLGLTDDEIAAELAAIAAEAPTPTKPTTTPQNGAEGQGNAQ